MTMNGKLLRMAVMVAGIGLSLAGSARGEQERAPRHEIALTLGGIGAVNRQEGIRLGSGTALQVNYGLRLVERGRAVLAGEFHFLASPLRTVTATDVTVTRDVASLYATPGVRLKLFPRSAVSPFVAVGGGYALYEQSLNRLDGKANPAPRLIHRGVAVFGGGADFRLWRFASLRAEVRDFYSGSPAYNAPAKGGQHNVVAGGGIVLRFR